MTRARVATVVTHRRGTDTAGAVRELEGSARRAGTKLRFSDAEAEKHRLIPGDGGAWLLPRTIGMSRACELLFTGDVIDAATAASWGLVSRVVSAASLMDEAMALAEKIAAQPPPALRLAKTLLKQRQTTSYDTQMEMSAAAQAISHLTEDHMEGVDSILEKRPAVFNGR